MSVWPTARVYLAFLVGVFISSFIAPPAYAEVLKTAYYNGHTYHLLDRASTWSDAETEAVALGGHLVTISDSAENAWILDTFESTALTNLGSYSGSPAFLLGLYRDRGSSDWKWVSGENSSFTHWAGTEPNMSEDELTAGMLFGNSGFGYASRGYWHDIFDPPASWDFTYGVVEVAAIPEPATFALLLGGLGVVASIGRVRKKRTCVA